MSVYMFYLQIRRAVVYPEPSPFFLGPTYSTLLVVTSSVLHRISGTPFDPNMV